MRFPITKEDYGRIMKGIKKLNILNYISQNSAKFKIVSEFSKENLKEGLSSW